MLRVVILGYGPLGLALARGTLKSDCATLAGVFPWSYVPTESHFLQEVTEAQFRRFLEQQHIPMIKAKGANHYQFIRALKTLKPDVVLVGSWGEILKPHVLETPNIRFINCHPALLPHHRGPNPYSAVLLANESYSGVTFHEIEQGIDTGAIYLQASLPINPLETGLSLRERCASLAESCVPKLLMGLNDQSMEPYPQPEGGSYDKLPEAIGFIDWHAEPESIAHKIRALYPWFLNYSFIGPHQISFQFGKAVSVKDFHKPLKPSLPGTILHRHHHRLWVSTQDPETLIMLEHPFIEGHSWVYNWLLKPFILKPGIPFTQDRLPSHAFNIQTNP